jgi:glycosyltransferase involved in cell wall biosynthesis
MTANQQRPIRILRIISRLNVGGPAVHVSLLTQKLRAPDYESLLICGNTEPEEGSMLYYAEAHGVHPQVIPELGNTLNPLRQLASIWRLYLFIRQYQPDIVHTHNAKAGFAGRVAAWLAGVPVIIHTFHGHIFDGYFGRFKSHLFLWLERLAARMSDTIIALTEGLRSEMAEKYHLTRRRRITVLPLGLDLEAFANTRRKTGEFRAQWNIPAHAPLIGIVGRLTPIKNHALFLQAAVKVCEGQPDARFVIIGDGELRADIESQVDVLNLRPSVIFTGWQRDVASVYSDLDVFVNCSINEGTPVPVIEALAAGCPVVVTAVGGVPELLDHGALGRLVPSNDATALSQAIIETLTRPPDTSEAQTTMRNRYAIDRLVNDLDGLYRGLLAKKRKRQNNA